MKGEKVFKGEKNVKYIFEKTYRETDSLVIVFSGFQSKNSLPKYNYRRTLDEFRCNKLFILDDFGARGSYYVCENKDFSIERSIITLINEIIEENNIKTVVTSGSSKGGYAALYYGIKYGFDYIIAASPQYYVGNYLLEEGNVGDVASFMAGDKDEEAKLFLNGILTNVIKSTTHRPNIFIHLGEGEKHYYNHVSPMIKDFERVGMSYILDLGDYEKHSDVAKFFPPIFKDKIREYLGFPKLEISVKRVDNGNVYRFSAFTEKNNTVAWHLYHNNKSIDKLHYLPKKMYDLLPKHRGNYKMTVFVKNKKGMIVVATSPVIHI